MDHTDEHDVLDNNIDSATAEIEEVEQVTDTAEVKSAEESAVNTDTDIALEADAAMEISPEMEITEDETPAPIEEKKKKSRESTSEKAKKAAAERVEKGVSPDAKSTKKKALDPLRLRGKKYRAVVAKVDKTKEYALEEAIELVKETSTTKFDSAVELHIRVKGDAVRGMVVLPHGTGKTKKVAVASDEVIEQIAAGKLDFDVLLATPAQMPKLAKYAKVLGPKGLMPSPKAGTVTDDIEKATAEIGGGRTEYRADKSGVVHMSIGRVSFATDKLVENFRAVETALSNAKVHGMSLASTMGPGVKLQVSK